MSDWAAEKAQTYDLFMVDCPNCEEPWRFGVDDEEQELYAYCECPGKEPEQLTDWVARFMAEQYDDGDTLKGYQ